MGFKLNKFIYYRAFLLCAVYLPEDEEYVICAGLVFCKIYIGKFNSSYNLGAMLDWSGLKHALSYVLRCMP